MTRPAASITQPADWRADAACHGMDPAIFHPDADDQEGRQAALNICRGCPVADACLDDALVTREKFGIRGGRTATQRRSMRPPVTVTCLCGTQFTSRTPQARFCSEPCRRRGHAQVAARSRGTRP